MFGRRIAFRSARPAASDTMNGDVHQLEWSRAESSRIKNRSYLQFIRHIAKIRIKFKEPLIPMSNNPFCCYFKNDSNTVLNQKTCSTSSNDKLM